MIGTRRRHPRPRQCRDRTCLGREVCNPTRSPAHRLGVRTIFILEELDEELIYFKVYN